MFFIAYTPVSAQNLSQGWHKICSKQDDVDICNTTNSIVSDSGHLLTAVNLVEIRGKQDERRIGVQVPTGRFLPEGINIQIGDNFSKKIPYIICDGPSCIANEVLDDKLIDAMKAGSKMVVTTTNFQGTVNPIELSLNGFTAAYTGSGIDEEAFQQKQMKLQQAIQLKQRELEERVKAEQKKAKQGE